MIVAEFLTVFGLIEIYVRLTQSVGNAAETRIEYLRVGYLQHDRVAFRGHFDKKVRRNFEVASFARTFAEAHPMSERVGIFFVSLVAAVCGAGVFFYARFGTCRRSFAFQRVFVRMLRYPRRRWLIAARRERHRGGGKADAR